MLFSVELQNEKEFRKKLPVFMDNIRSAVSIKARKNMEESKNAIILSMRNTPKTGRAYKKPSGRIHIASSPGNPPAVDTGNLVSNIIIDSKKDKSSFSLMELGATTKAFYAPFLEFGTSKMEARPSFSPVFDTFLSKTRNNVSNVIKDSIRRGFV